ncbi:hypothetical protein LTR15_012582 [Elasticomyces elasticus]|nr:hypothetical protein LTR15_012582 [Elasticomyces elasticus]
MVQDQGIDVRSTAALTQPSPSTSLLSSATRTAPARSSKARQKGKPNSISLNRMKGLSLLSARSRQTFRLLDLPAELRLLIYEAYFGPKRERRIYWEEDDKPCFFHLRADRNRHSAALLRVCRQVRNEAQPVLHETNVPLLTDILVWCGRPYGGPGEATVKMDMQFLEQVPAVAIGVILRNSAVHDCWDLLNAMLAFTGYGKELKSLSFIFDSVCDEEVFAEDGELTEVIFELKCPSSAVTIHIHNPKIESESAWIAKSGFAVRKVKELPYL